jgi:hypothetical protein
VGGIILGGDNYLRFAERNALQLLKACGLYIDWSSLHFKIYMGWGGWFLGETAQSFDVGDRCIGDMLMIQLRV